MLELNIKLYGNLKAYAPGHTTQFEMRVEPGACFEDVLKVFAIPHNRFVALINGRRPGKEDTFADGDTLVLLPEISGG